VDVRRFDEITKLFASRRPRRAALVAGGAGLAATLMNPLDSRSTAQESTPAVDPDRADGRTAFLFVQVFESGSIAPNPETSGRYTVTLSHTTAQTIFFSDRPERIVGAVPTIRFLNGLNFTPDNPPNAALVSLSDAGDDILVVELLNPRYTESFGPDGAVSLTYDVQILADYQGDGLTAVADRQLDAEPPTALGPTSLFIDDCSDQRISCCSTVAYSDGIAQCTNAVGTIGPVGFCWSFGDFCCQPCESDDIDYWGQKCIDQFPDCAPNCTPFLGDSCW
jgi:hypothetical protein